MSEPGGYRDAKGHSSIDDVIELYKRDVDRTLLRENLKLTPEQRVRKFMAVLRFVDELRRSRRST